jgi:hypothetical protein
MEVSWKGDWMRFEINGRDVTDASASFRLPGQVHEELGSSLTDPGAHAACTQEIADRSGRYAPTPQKGTRALTLDEEKKNLSELLQSLRDDIDAVTAGRSHKIRNVRGALRELVVYLGGPSYQPALFRVASRVGAPLPICATRGGRIKEVDRILEKPQGLGISFGRFGTKIFKPGVLIDLEAWMRDPVVLDRRPLEVVQSYSVAQLVSKAAENLGGAHLGPNIPLTIDALENTLQENASQLTHFFMALAEVVLELGAFVLAWQPPPAPAKS